MAESFVYRQYKGHDIELPLTDEMRKFLQSRSKDTLIAECDEVWANLNNRPEEVEEENGEFSYNDFTKPELVAEINERNKVREDADRIVVPSGAKKDDLITLLEDDDDSGDDEDPATE